MRHQQRSLVSAATFVLVAFPGWASGEAYSQHSKPGDEVVKAKSNEPADSSEQNDESLTSDEYIHLGLPAHDRVWAGFDMVKAQHVLTSLVTKGYGRLPRYKSPRSGEVFARMTAPQNLEFFRARTLPVEVRLPQALQYYLASNEILKLYISGQVKREVRGSDLVELMGSQLRTTVVMLELVDEFLPTLKKDDPTYPVRMQGVERMKRGLAGVVAGGLQTLTEDEVYRREDLFRLVGYMQETFPLIVPQLPPGARAETMVRLEQMQADPTLIDFQAGLGEIRLKVKEALEKAKTP